MKKFLLFFAILTTTFCVSAQQNFVSNPTDSVSSQPMYMLTYDHGGLILWGGEHFQERLRNAVSWLDKYPGFKIGLDNEAHMYDKLSRENPELLDEIKTDLKKYPGRFGIGTCTYGQPLSQFINEESNIRQIQYALKSLKKHFNYTPGIYLMSEHAMHSQIPQILKGFGFKGAIMRTHFMMYGYNPTYNEPFGWWVGMDGSRIATVPTYTGEGAEFFKTPVDNWVLTRYPSDECRTSLADFRKQFSHINPLLASRADDSGLRREELVKEYEGNPMYRWILLDELLKKYPEPKAEFKTLPDDFKVRMPWGYCGNKIWNTSREAEIKVLTAERLAAFDFIFNGNDSEKQLEKAWENLLVAQHHDIQIVGLTNDADNYLKTSLEASGKVIRKSLDDLAGRMSCDGIQQITAFNPVSWSRSQWVETTVSFEKGQAKSIDISDNGRKIPVTVLQNYLYSDGSIYEAKVAFAPDIPPLSLKSYSVVPVADHPFSFTGGLSVNKNDLTINTPFYTVRLNPGGGIAMLTRKADSKSIFRNDKRSAFFNGLIDGKEAESAGKWVISETGEKSPWVVATEYGFIADIPYTFEMIFYSNAERIDCSAEFDFNGQKIGQLSDDQRDRISPFIHDKKLRFKCYPDVSGGATGIRDLPFMVAETNDQNIEGNYWTAVSDGKTGLAFFNRGTMGAIRETDGGFSIPLSYAMYYIWGTRMLNGKYSHEFALYPFSGNWKNANLHKSALEYNFPVVSTESKAGDGTLGNYLSVIDKSPDNTVVSALYSENKKVFIRLYEDSGLPAAMPTNPFKTFGKIEETDLAGNPVKQLPGVISFKPWEIKTFRIK